MYVPSYATQDDRDLLLRFMKDHNFATLVSGPDANHYPFLVSEEDEKIYLWTHLARGNPQWKAFENDSNCLVIFTGPHAYISPTFYKDKLNVPTWNYTAVHARCEASVVSDERLRRRLMKELVASEEKKNGTSWDYDLPTEFEESLQKAIVWLRLEVSHLQGKFKLSQNRDAADYQGVLENLKNEDVLKYMRLTRPLEVKRLGPDAANEVQALLESRSDYHQKIGSYPFTGKEGLDALTELPSGKAPDSKFCFGFYHGKELVAFVDLIRGHPEESTAYLGLLIIHGGFQSKGLGRSVYEKTEAIVKEWSEISTLRLAVVTTNEVFGYWEKMGFVRFGEPKKSSVPGAVAVEMKKTLN